MQTIEPKDTHLLVLCFHCERGERRLASKQRETSVLDQLCRSSAAAGFE